MMRGPRAWRAAAAVLVTVIVVAGLLPTHEALSAVVGEAERAATIAGHFAQYTLLGFVLPVAQRGWRPGWRVVLTAGLAAVGLGLAVEAVQLALPYRSAEAGDAVVNSAGVALGLALVSWTGRVKERRSRWRRG